jgi:hypothetical protein
MKRSSLSVTLVVIYVLVLSVKVYSSTDKPQTYVSKSGSISSPQYEYSGLLLAQQMKDSTRVESFDSIKLKDPNMAILYAVIPGIVIHGAGHFYAGKRTTAAVLFASGFIGASCVYVGGLSGLERTAPTETGYILIITGAILFTGSWTYDLIGAPLAVQKQNQNFLGKRSADLKFEFDHKHDSIKVVLTRQF